MPSNFILMSLHNSNPLFSLLVKHSLGVTGFRFFFFFFKQLQNHDGMRGD